MAKISEFPKASGLNNADLFPIVQDSTNKTITLSQLKDAIPSGSDCEPATEAPLMDGEATVGLSTKYARADHVHPTDTSRADHNVEKVLEKYNRVNLCDKLSHTNKTTMGATFTWNDSVCTVSGTTTAITFNDLFSSKTSLPENIKSGDVLSVEYEGTNVEFIIYDYSTSSPVLLGRFKTNGIIKIPDTSTGLIIRLWIASGTTINETVCPKLFKFDNTKGAAINNLREIGDLYTDADDIYNNSIGFVSLVSGAPSVANVPYSPGWLETYVCTPEIILQRMIPYQPDKNKSMTRIKQSGKWTAWVDETVKSDADVPLSPFLLYRESQNVLNSGYYFQSICYNSNTKKFFIFCGSNAHDAATVCFIAEDLTDLSTATKINLNASHCNDCTYDPVNDRILVCGNYEYQDEGSVEKNRIFILNPETGAVEDSFLFDTTLGMTAIEYVDGYFMAADESYLYKCSLDFTSVEQICGMTKSDMLKTLGDFKYNASYRQGFFHANGYLYRTLSIANGIDEYACFIQYTLDGKIVKSKIVPLYTYDELQGGVFVDDAVYFLSSGAYSSVWKLDFKLNQTSRPQYMAIISNSNLNNIKIPGKYICQNKSVAQTLLGRPSTLSGSFMMDVEQIGSQDLTQSIYYATAIFYKRKYSLGNNTWSSWFKWEPSETDTTVDS